MYNGKKITKEDTWRPTDLIKHMQGQEEESRRRERSHRDPEREKMKHREESGRRGEARDERVKESRRGEARDERVKESRRGEARDEREKESRRGEARDERQKESRRGEARDEREKERKRGEARDERVKESRRGEARDEREKESRRGEARDERQKESRRGEARDEREKESRRGEARDERQKESRRGEARDEREKESRRGEARDEREKESRRGEARDEREKESRRGEARDEREKERKRGEARDEREKERKRGEARDEREKERKRGEARDEREKERNRGDGLKERVKARDMEKDSEREKRNTEKERKTERDREKYIEREKRHRQNDRDRLIEKERDRGEERDKEKDRERERRRKEREHERRKEKRVSLTVYDTSLEREKERKERQREREHHRGGEEQERNQSEQDRREKDGHRQHTGHTDGDERREQKRREKEQHSRFNHDGEIEGAREREERDKLGDREKEVKGDVLEKSREGGAEDHGNEDYEDDFEDYEEDFEEFDEEEEKDEKRSAERNLSPRSRQEVEAIQRAMEKENELLSTTHSTSSTQESEISLRASADLRKSRTYGRVIDFTAARQRDINQQVADKQKKRSAELLRLIDLDFSVTECFLDLPPVREYDLYIKSYGMANTKQAYVQSNEDNTERDTQTEETDLIPKWTQHPPESSVACGGPQVSQNASGEAVTMTTVDSKRLAAFLCSAAQVMAVLLEENIAESNSVKKIQSQTHTHSFSDGCVQLNTQLNLLQGRQVTLLHFSQTQTHTLLSVHALCSGSSDVTLDSETLICVWNIWEPSTPQRILIYEAEVRSCCFSPGKATLVFAGTDVGSVLVWDLREPSSSHTNIGVCEEAWTLRHPTFSTDAVLSGVGHFSSVVSVEPVLVNVGAGLRDPLLSEQEESLGLSFQLGSLDENGLLNLWVVVELPKADESGSQTDLGLRPGGKVKLLHSSSLQTNPQVDKVTSPLSSVLKFLPSDSNHYFIGSNMGLVRHGTRHGLRAVPKLYRPKDGERPAKVTALDFCSTGEPFFLVGCSDGSVRLHALACADAVCEWPLRSGHSSVWCVRFSPTRCSVFCALDSKSVLHIWDLTQRDDSPLITHDLGTDPVSTMTVFGDATRKNPYSGIALAKCSGKLEIHFLISSLTLPQASDVEILHSLTQDTL